MLLGIGGHHVGEFRDLHADDGELRLDLRPDHAGRVPFVDNYPDGLLEFAPPKIGLAEALVAVVDSDSAGVAFCDESGRDDRA